jgi:tetratricopeptide (TPR) repeat protein
MEKRYLTILFLAIGILCVFLIGCRNASSLDQAAIQEKTEVIMTYPFSDPDPVPILARPNMWGRGAKLYPYYFFDGFSKTGKGQKWQVVWMENSYIKVSILPQVGGKIWGAAEKLSNKDFIYTNHVLKFREIALRGPWTSGGIEFNFGIIGHTPSTAAPVDYFLCKNKDGSVSCIVGTLDLPSRTRWSVTITLPKDKAYVETNAFWYNPSPFNQSYYCWMTPAIKAAKDLKYIFPGRYSIGHDYSVPLEPWPVDKHGRDLSLYKNNNFSSSKSYFTVGEYEDFYGVYYQNSDSGFGHWASSDDVPGRKIWIWDLSRQGEIWVDLLTDTDGQYSEPQAGRLLNQSDHEFFLPCAADRWKEIWFPYMKIGSMVKASPYGVLNVTQTANSLKVALFALQKINDDLVAGAEGKEFYREHLRLKPMEIYEKTIPVADPGKIFEVNLGHKLNYSSDPRANDIQRPIRFQNYDETTAEGLFLAANRYDKERNYHQALEKYLACLAKEPLHLRALCRVAELYTRRGEYQKALDSARKALETAMYDSEANYIYGVISQRLGNLVDAKETLGWAARSMEYRSPAYSQLAEIYFLERNYDRTLEYAQQALDFNKYNLNAYQIMATAYRKMGKVKEARQILGQILKIDPLNHLARFETYLLEPTPERLENFQSMIRNEFPHETYLEIALYFVKLGLGDDAIRLLKKGPAYPPIYYWLSYLLKEKTPQESEVYLNQASALSAWLVFPFREESIPVFQWAAERRLNDWKPKYYLGLIYWVKGRVPEALQLFDECGQPDFGPFYLARGYLFQEADPQKTLADLEQAVKVDEKSWRTWHYLISFYQKLGVNDKALISAKRAVQLFPNEVPIQIDLVQALMNINRQAEAASILDKVEALPYEGASEIHGLFVKCQIQLALEDMKSKSFCQAIEHLEKSKEYPERLGTGKPFNPDYRLQDYLEALCYEKLQDKEKAEAARKAIYDYTFKNWEEQTQNQYFGGLVLLLYGEKEKAKELLNKGIPPREILEMIREMSK